MSRVYVAGPYSQGDKDVNVERAMLIGARLLAAGHQPFVPHLAHFWDRLYPQDYDRWMAWCLEWLEKCEAVLRLPGASSGADRETARARELAIPVFYSLDDLQDSFGYKREELGKMNVDKKRGMDQIRDLLTRLQAAGEVSSFVYNQHRDTVPEYRDIKSPDATHWCLGDTVINISIILPTACVKEIRRENS